MKFVEKNGWDMHKKYMSVEIRVEAENFKKDRKHSKLMRGLLSIETAHMECAD